MSLRHVHRQPDRDIRMHDPHPPHPHTGPAHAHPVHLNGSVPNTPGGLSNGHAAIVSPVVPPSATGHTNGVAVHPSIQKLAKANEETWLLIGAVSEQMGDLDRALSAYENALRHNPLSVSGLTQVAGIARIKENYPRAVEFFQRVLSLQQDNGEIWSALGHCYLMQDDLQKAYSAYQQALYLLPNPKEDPKLWYGIGILYDRYGSLDHAEEAFASVLQMDQDFDKANEILFRLGIIYKQQAKYQESLECFDRILRNPPSPLAHADIWFQIGHVYEQQKDHVRAKDAYERVVADNPHHAKVLQQLGWLYHQDGSSFQNQDLAITYLTKSLETDPSDAQSWYLLGRAYMAGQKYNKAYEAYQQAVYRDGRNPTFWCSIGVLYFQINQYRDALDAYSRAIRINPYISEVWFDLGSLYESCNNQISDAIDAYARASELDPTNHVITQRLQLLRNAQATGGQLPAAPGPQDVHPTAYASAVGPPVSITGGGPPLLMHSGPAARSIFSRSESRGPAAEGGMPLPSPHAQHAPAPFRGGPPPPVVLDENRRPPNHTPLAPMDVERTPIHARDPSAPFPPRDANGARNGGPGGQQSLLLHHPQPQPQPQHPHDQPSHCYARESYGRPRRASSPPPSPPPSHRPHHSPSDPLPYQGYPPNGTRGPPSGPPSAVPSQRSPRAYPGASYDPPNATSPPPERGDAWDRRSDRGSRSRHNSRSGPPPPLHTYGHPRAPSSPASAHPFDARRTPPSAGLRAHSPPSRGELASQRSPIVPAPSGPGGPSRAFWEGRVPPSTLRRYAFEPGPSPRMEAASPPPELPSRRYDPRFDESQQAQRREPMEREMPPRHDVRSHAGSPDFRPAARVPPPHGMGAGVSGAFESPYPPLPAPVPEHKDRRRRGAKDKDAESGRAPTPAQSGTEPAKKERRRRNAKKGGKDEQGGDAVSRASSHQPASSKMGLKAPPSPEPVSSVSASGSGSGRSGRPSPAALASLPPTRVVDEDYDEGVDGLMSLASYRPPTESLPPISPTSTRRAASPPPPQRHGSHRSSISSSGGRHTPPLSGSSGSLKRPLSPPLVEMDSKRSRIEILNRRVSPGGRHTPVPSSRPSPIPFRTQPSRSPDDRHPEMRLHDRSPTSTGIPSTLPLPPPPSAVVAPVASVVPVTLPPIATLSPASTGTGTGTGGASPVGEDERMQVDRHSRSISPPQAVTRATLVEVTHPVSPTSARGRRSASPQQSTPSKDKSASPRS